ncbi:MAG: hypothetical protein ABIN96_16120 [Rubrivivax sp.]
MLAVLLAVAPVSRAQQIAATTTAPKTTQPTQAIQTQAATVGIPSPLSADAAANPPTEKTSGGSRRNNALPAAIIGTAALIAIGSLLLRERTGATTPSSAAPPNPDEITTRLLNEGPQMAPAFNMSAFAVRGFVRGGWPVLVDFERSSPGSALLRISARDLADVYTYDLSQVCPQPRRCVVQFRLPVEVFGDQLRPAVFAAIATDLTGQQTMSDFVVHALGCGPRAIGSVAIDQIDFGPPTIRVADKQRAMFRFFSHSDFGHAAVEFWKINGESDGNRLTFVDDRAIDRGLRKNEWVGMGERREWDGIEKGSKVSTGAHKVQVRAWDRVGDWLTSWSRTTVNVER